MNIYKAKVSASVELVVSIREYENGDMEIIDIEDIDVEDFENIRRLD